MSKKIVYVPRCDIVTYTNAEGNPETAYLYLNRDYQFTFKDGSSCYGTVSSVVTEKTPNGSTTINIGIELNPGFMNVMTESDRHIKIEDIVSIVDKHAKYNRVRRTFKKGVEGALPRPDAEPFTFAFDNPNFKTPYRITVYEGEFVSLIVNNEKNERSTIYGTVNAIDDDGNVFITRYTAKRGVRSIVMDYKIDHEKLRGVYRFELEMEPYVENVDKKNNDEAE